MLAASDCSALAIQQPLPLHFIPTEAQTRQEGHLMPHAADWGLGMHVDGTRKQDPAWHTGGSGACTSCQSEY